MDFVKVIRRRKLCDFSLLLKDLPVLRFYITMLGISPP